MLSIVIPSYSRADLLELCLRTVTRFAPTGTEVIVVDDASDASVISQTAAGFAGVRVIRLPKRSGFCIAANAGIAAATGEVVELLNDDTEVTAGWADAALRWFANPRIGAVAPLVLQHDPERQRHGLPPRIDSAGDEYDCGGFARKRLRGQESGIRRQESGVRRQESGDRRQETGDRKQKATDRKQEAGSRGRAAGGSGTELSPVSCLLSPVSCLLSPAPVWGVSATAGFYRRDALVRAGAFPTDFGAYFEDVDLSFRLRQLGCDIWFDPASVVWHRVSASYGKRPSRRVLERQSCNEERVFWRNMRGRERWRNLPRHVAVLVAKALRRIEDGTFGPWCTGRLRALVMGLQREKRTPNDNSSCSD